MRDCSYGRKGRAEPAPATTTDVVVVGGGPVGLTLALLLRGHGIDVVVLEAHAGPSRHPKARGVAARSMETFRAAGIERAVREAALSEEQVRFYRGRTLLDPDGVVGPPPPTRSRGNTPSPGVLCPQDRLEPVLVRAARAAGATVLFSHRVTGIARTATGVRVTHDAPGGGPPRTTEGAYVVGCDGAGSIVRDQAGIALGERRELGTFLSVRFTAALGGRVAGRLAASYFLAPGLGGFLAVDNDREWIYQYPVPPDAEVASLRADESALTALVHAAIGAADVAIHVHDTMLWRMDTGVARSFREGRILLAGDAAHQIPPTGGHGMNVGIGDAEGLAWRLARVVLERASDGLLEHYGAERRAVAAAVTAISVDNAGREYGIDDELLLGTTYGSRPPVVAQSYRPSGLVGRRLPHVALQGDAVSTLDLVGNAGTLVLPAPDAAWAAAVAATPPLRGVSVVACTTEARNEVATGDFARRTGLGPGEGLLLRPDGHVVVRVPRAPTPAAVRGLAVAWAREAGGDAPTPPAAARSRPS